VVTGRLLPGVVMMLALNPGARAGQAPACPGALTVRNAHGMAYDSARGKVVLFGGYQGRRNGWAIPGNGTERVGMRSARRGHRHAGTPLGPEFSVNTTLGYAGSPSVAADTADFVVVWESYAQDGSSSGVFGQRYGRIVPVELMYFRVE